VLTRRRPPGTESAAWATPVTLIRSRSCGPTSAYSKRAIAPMKAPAEHVRDSAGGMTPLGVAHSGVSARTAITPDPLGFSARTWT
jgi:hypothetical protein